MDAEQELINEGSQGMLAQLQAHGLSWISAGAVSGLCGGIVLPILGAVLTAITWFTGPIWHGIALRRDGSVLLFLSFPLLIFGAHCLDLLQRQRKEGGAGLNN